VIRSRSINTTNKPGVHMNKYLLSALLVVSANAMAMNDNQVNTSSTDTPIDNQTDYVVTSPSSGK